MKKVMFIVNHEVVIYNFRKELISELINQGYDVYILSPNGKKIEKLKKLGCKHIETDINRHGTNPIQDYKLVRLYKKIMKKINPDVVLTYTIKPNIYGGWAAKSFNIPYIANITGLGSAIENPGIIQKITLALYRNSFKKVDTVFFQNQENQKFFENRNIANGKYELLPGSGVNISDFTYSCYPKKDVIEFGFVSRIMKEKGIDEYLELARRIKSEIKNTRFHVVGFIDGDYQKVIDDEVKKGNIIYHGMVEDVSEIYKNLHCIILPSYHEGMSNVLLEASAVGRPIIASNIPGCREIIEEEKTGFLCDSRNAESLYKTTKKFLNLSLVQKEEMGKNARIKIESEFNRQLVVDKYLKKIGEL